MDHPFEEISLPLVLSRSLSELSDLYFTNYYWREFIERHYVLNKLSDKHQLPQTKNFRELIMQYDKLFFDRICEKYNKEDSLADRINNCINNCIINYDHYRLRTLLENANIKDFHGHDVIKSELEFRNRKNIFVPLLNLAMAVNNK
jgi:hypothetical protein